MNREKLLEHLCPSDNIDICCSKMGKITCKECDDVMNTYLDEYDKHVIAEYEAEHGNLADTIPDEVVKQIRADAIDEAKDEIVDHLNDYALQEAPIYQDDLANQRPVYLAIKNCINGVIEIAEQLKEQK